MRKFFLNIKQITIIATLFLLPGLIATAQDGTFDPIGSFAIEISLENSPYLRLPIYQNSISSLTVKGDYILGGTSAANGLTPFLFIASLSKRQLIDTFNLNGIIPGQRSIQSGFCHGSDGIIYAGTIPNKGGGISGHLIQITISQLGKMKVSDLGVPVHGEGVCAITCDSAGTVLYGISFPTGIFFVHNLKTGQTKTYSNIVPTQIDLNTYYEFALGPQDYLSRRLISDNQGRVYGSSPINKIFCFDPKAETFHFLIDPLPTIWGRGVMGRVDSWVKSKDGALYGGNSGDGQLFRLNPSTDSVINLGKPIMMNRIKGLVFGDNGKLYGIAGSKPGYTHIFSYDPNEGGFEDYGYPQFEMVAPGIEQGIPWRGFQLATMATSDDGKYIVMGEDESLSQILVFPVSLK
jgi:hypothetical protein